MILVILLTVVALGGSDLDLRPWVQAAGLMLLAQGSLWVIARRGWDERFEWDPDFLQLPLLVTVALFTVYMFLVPGGRQLLLMAWFVALLFGAGQLGFREVASVATVMALAYLAAAWELSRTGWELSMAVEGLWAAVFLAVNLYAGAVFEQLRSRQRETQELRRELAQQALTDPLTGLPNRRYLEEFLQAELARIRRYGGKCAVVMVDVDDFKHYNDELGHLAGDRILRMLGETMQKHLRVSDVAARFGGEEFGIIMVNTEPAEAGEAAERLRGKIEATDFPREEIQPGEELTVSAGYACCPKDGQSYEELIEAADRAMYQAKEEGKNCVQSA